MFGATGCCEGPFTARRARHRAAIVPGKLFLAAAIMAAGLLPVLSPFAAAQDAAQTGGSSWIAFNNVGVMMAMNPDGTGQVQVTDSSAVSTPAWSPVFSDGSIKLAYAVPADDGSSDYLEILDFYPSLGQRVRLLPSWGGIFQLHWSPTTVTLADGKQKSWIAYATFDPNIGGGNREVIRIVELIYDGSTFAAGDQRVLDAGPGAEYWQARFSPDNQHLALGRIDYVTTIVRRKRTTTAVYSIWLANFDGTNQRELIKSGYDWYPAWKPDGTELAFISGRGGGSDVYVYRFEAGSVVEPPSRLTTTGFYKEWPSWSPDGREIAFVGSTKRFSGIMKVVRSSGQQINLTGGGGPGCPPDPEWSPMVFPPP